jgi:hypothetical protein
MGQGERKGPFLRSRRSRLLPGLLADGGDGLVEAAEHGFDAFGFFHFGLQGEHALEVFAKNVLKNRR